jgi:HEAT repeat protein
MITGEKINMGGKTMRFTTLFLCAVAVAMPGLWLTWCSAAEGPANPKVERLKSKDEKVRLSASEELLAERQKTIHDLLTLIEAKSPTVRWLSDESTTEGLAIRVLGEMRAIEAVPALIKWATPPEGGYLIPNLEVSPSTTPAARALIKIGKPAEPALLEVVKQSPQKRIWSISLSILQEIEGPKCLEVILEDAIAKETEAAAKANLQEGLKRLQSGAGFYPRPTGEPKEPKT